MSLGLVIWPVLFVLSAAASPEASNRALQLPESGTAAEARAAVQCGTSSDTTERHRQLGDWVRARHRESSATRRPVPQNAETVRFENGIFVMATDEVVTPFDRPEDLEGSSLVFKRIDSERFLVQKVPLNYEEPAIVWRTFHGQEFDTRQLPFPFPFFDKVYDTVYLSSARAVFFGPPPTVSFDQYDDSQAVLQRVPLLAPFLAAYNLGTAAFGGLVVYVDPSGTTSATVTWRSTASPSDQDIQVTLYSNGDFRFSYRTIRPNSLPYPASGAVLVTSGAEPFYDLHTTLVSVSDPAGDVTGSIPEDQQGMVDIRSLSVNRIGDSDLLEVQIMVDEEFTPSLSPARSLGVSIQVWATEDDRSQNWMSFGVFSDGRQESGGIWPRNQPRGTIQGRVVRVQFLQSALTLSGPAAHVQVQLSYSGETTNAYDLTSATFAVENRFKHISTDLSALTSPTEMRGPIIETFMLPTVNLYGIWDRLKAQYGFASSAIDHVAVYQSFHTDLSLTSGIGGFAVGGNSGSDGVRPGSWVALPKAPTLLHMNSLDRYQDPFAPYPDPVDYNLLRVQTHEFAHRWLYFPLIQEDGEARNSMNSDGVHPNGGVHVPAAFNVFSSTDSSVMGGGYWTQVSPSTYAYTKGPIGLSWHELYLMGLAASEEVPDWFYLSGPGLGNPYWLPEGQYEVTARTNVTQRQLELAMGPRRPQYPASDRTFALAAVILERATNPITPAALRKYEEALLKRFAAHVAAITGGRGRVLFVTPDYRPGRRRSVRH